MYTKEKSLEPALDKLRRRNKEIKERRYKEYPVQFFVEELKIRYVGDDGRKA